jgi:uncharacterized protein (TIGR03663 family)
MDSNSETRPFWLDRPITNYIKLNWEMLLVLVILLLAIISRLYILGARVMSHDETSHVYFSWLLYTGQGYRHDPVTHGPLQFHLVALMYFLFGDSDFTARLSQALFSIATVAAAWGLFRRYLGRLGGLILSVLFLISPYMLYYGRYARNESYVALFGVVMLWATLRYLETGRARYMYLFTASIALHYTSKETSFIYAAQILMFLGLYMIYRVTQRAWDAPEFKRLFLVGLIVTAVLLAGAAGTAVFQRAETAVSPTSVITPAVPGQNPLSQQAAQPATRFPLLLALLGGVAMLAAAFFLVRGYTWQKLCEERSFSLMIMLFSLVLPTLTAFPVKFLGHNPIDYSNNSSLIFTGVFLGIMIVLGAGMGLLWNPRRWLINLAIFYSIFIVFYTTLFTNGFGIFTGLVGSLGYWLEQQGVNRGSQPWYYYILVQVPVYEYLPALGSLLALALGLGLNRRNTHREAQPDFEQPDLPESALLPDDPARFGPVGPHTNTLLALLGFWSLTSLAAYSVAGEKMPWLTVHITLGLILLAGWGLARLVELIDWRAVWRQRGPVVLALLLVFVLSALGASASLLGDTPPFQGKTLDQLQATSTFLSAVLAAVISGAALVRFSAGWTAGQLTRTVTLIVFGLLAVLTARVAVVANFIHYDLATELLVYAHMAPGPKIALAQIEEISRRTTDGLGIEVAYDDEMTYPYWWYLRDYPNKRFYGKNPTRDLREAPVIVVGSTNYDKIEPVVAQGYYMFEYNRIWWPYQGYFNLTWDRLAYALTNRDMRRALFDIWLNRDYTRFAQLNNLDMSLPNWDPALKFRLYIRKDIAAKIWNYGVAPTAEQAVIDPYQGKGILVAADKIIGSPGNGPGQFNRPRGLAIAPDGSLYIADTDNSRIVHIAADGTPLHSWGTFADILKGPAPEGTMNQPWGVAVGPDGSVYVADTFNFRIEKYTADGQFIKMWGYFGQAEVPEAFWGPRDVAVDAKGQLYVVDTGNKRIVIFDADGNYISQFGTVGLGAGQFDEPVGIAFGPEGQVYVTDTWNQRIQEFTRAEDGSFTPINSWDVSAWYGQSLDNKPYITVDSQGHVFATDPEGARVLEWDGQGQFIRYFGESGSEPTQFGLAGAVKADPAGGLWVTDAGNSRLMHFVLP